MRPIIQGKNRLTNLSQKGRLYLSFTLSLHQLKNQGPLRYMYELFEVSHLYLYFTLEYLKL